MPLDGSNWQFALESLIMPAPAYTQDVYCQGTLTLPLQLGFRGTVIG